MNKTKGNMYKHIDLTANPLAGECSHKCGYCYVEGMKKRFPAIKAKYSVAPRIDRKALQKIKGSGKRIFIVSMNDLFADQVPEPIILEILAHCSRFDNEYLFQTKNPKRLMSDAISKAMPAKSILTITVETDNYFKQHMKDSPSIGERLHYAEKISEANPNLDLHLTIEPIMKLYKPDYFAFQISQCNPKQVNIGADSGNNNLPEPSDNEIQKLIEQLIYYNIPIVLKPNLKRLYPKKKIIDK